MSKPKLRYRKQQIAALKNLYKGYTNGEGLEDCPLCNIKDSRCSNCVWVVETDHFRKYINEIPLPEFEYCAEVAPVAI